MTQLHGDYNMSFPFIAEPSSSSFHKPQMTDSELCNSIKTAYTDSTVRAIPTKLTNITINDLLNKLKIPQIGPKDGAYFIRSTILDPDRRSDKTTAEKAQLIIIDVDSGIKEGGAPDPIIVHNNLKSKNINHFIYRTYSHGSKGNRYRILFITDRAYSRDELSSTVAHAIELTGNQIANAKENNTWSQPWYTCRIARRLPRKGRSQEFTYYEYTEGDLLPVIKSKPGLVSSDTAPITTSISPASLSPIDAFNQQNPIEDMLSKAGYVQKGDKWLHPNSQSGIPGVSVINNQMYSHHGCDPLNDGKSHDSFDLLEVITGKFHDEAISHAAKITKAPNGQSVDEYNKSQLNKNKQHNSPDKNPISLIRASELTSKSFQVDWLIKNIIETNKIVVLYAPPASAKSFIVLDMAFCVSTGLPWHGHKTKIGDVIYIAGEGHDALQRRFKVLENNYNERSDNIFLTGSAIDLNNKNCIKNLVVSINGMSKKPVLIIIDTLQRNYGTGDENSAKDMANFISNIDTYLKINGATVLIVHHTGHSNTHARGSSVLNASTDLSFKVSKKDEFITLSNDKSKDSEEGKALRFKLVTSETGELDEDGEAITSAVLKTVNHVSEPKSSSLSMRESQVFNALIKILETKGEIISSGDNTSGEKFVHGDIWLQAATSKLKVKSQDEKSAKTAKGRAFTRAKDKLLELGKVHEQDGYFTLHKE